MHSYSWTWQEIILRYCWWPKSCTTWDMWNPVNNGMFTTNLNWWPQVCCAATFTRQFDWEPKVELRQWAFETRLAELMGRPKENIGLLKHVLCPFVCWVLFSQLSVSLWLSWLFLFISFILNGDLFWNDAILNWHCETIWDESQFLRGHGKDTWSVAAW